MTLRNLKPGGLSTNQREQLAGYVKLLLLWVAASDGDIDESELEFAGSQFPDAEGIIQTKELLAIIRKADFVEIEKAIRALSTESRELRIAFLDLAISMSIADKEIAITENHILRFYADALFLGSDLLKKRFQAICGSPYFEPGDPGNPEWWAQDSENKLERDRNITPKDDAAVSVARMRLKKIDDAYRQLRNDAQ